MGSRSPNDRASYIAWRTLLGEDLYPHIRELGQATTTQDLLDAWTRTVAQHREGQTLDRAWRVRGADHDPDDDYMARIDQVV